MVFLNNNEYNLCSKAIDKKWSLSIFWWNFISVGGIFVVLFFVLWWSFHRSCWIADLSDLENKKWRERDNNVHINKIIDVNLVIISEYVVTADEEWTNQSTYNNFRARANAYALMCKHRRKDEKKQILCCWKCCVCVNERAIEK